MGTGRVEAFSDAVIAIVMTIMVLELRAPEGTSWTRDIRPVLPVLLTYVLSFAYLAIYWNNHHHLLQITERINGKILWANMHLLFWLSLVPFTTAWMGRNDFESLPTAVYGVVLLLAAIAYLILQTAIVAEHGRDSALARALGKDLKGKISAGSYVSAIPLAFVNRWIALALYVFVALIWLVPDRRIESNLTP
ncbi:MAG: TMEM175 family protein [Actinomycetota bacterium]